MKNNYAKRVGRLMREIRIYKTMADSCERIANECPHLRKGLTSLYNACYKRINHLDNKLYNMLLSKMKGVSVAGQITDADIESARNKDITELLPVANRGKVLCPFHPDKNPSGSIKNNRFKCWSCGASHDTIGVFMHQNNVSFVEAVKALR